MPRIPFPQPETMGPEQRRVYDAIVSGPRGGIVGPLLAALHRPELADRWQQLGELLRYRTSLPTRLSELAILVTARRWNSILEWHIHEGVAVKADLSRDVIEAIRRNQTPDFSGDEEGREIYAFASELQYQTQVSDEAYQAVLARWEIVGVVELAALIGYYTMVAMTLNAHVYDLPEGAAHPFPELMA
ncbi:MAG: carboxymuconolactone decarboxylase family protein [Terricaulis sp.]|nr:carboxymuconolactone decarboxylase family protein [Terricaulis sp.]